MKGRRSMRRIAFVLATLTLAGLAGPAALAEPVPPIDWRDFVDEVVDPDLDVGEEEC